MTTFLAERNRPVSAFAVAEDASRVFSVSAFAVAEDASRCKSVTMHPGLGKETKETLRGAIQRFTVCVQNPW